MINKILCVDDEANVLTSFQRNLRKQFDLDTAESGQEGLDKIAASGPDAVNEGNIFRFLSKPCSPEMLAKALEGGLAQYCLITAEKELLEKTLSGSIQVLTEILSLVNPTAFSRAARIRQYMKHVATSLKLPDVWQFELAAMLSHIGCVTLPTETLDQLLSGQPVSDQEVELYRNHPKVAKKLLQNIPRLEKVVGMIAEQRNNFSDWGDSGNASDPVRFGAQALKAAVDYDQHILGGKSHRAAISEMQARSGAYNPTIVESLEAFNGNLMKYEIRNVGIHEINCFMLVDQNVFAKTGVKLVARGQQITPPLLERLRSFAAGIGIEEPIRVRVPRADKDVKPSLDAAIEVE
jgi:response regulator RpfG family c-di-GMP phosphodiesterase